MIHFDMLSSLLLDLFVLLFLSFSGLGLRACFFGAAIALQFFAFDYFKVLLQVGRLFSFFHAPPLVCLATLAYPGHVLL